MKTKKKRGERVVKAWAVLSTETDKILDFKEAHPTYQRAKEEGRAFWMFNGNATILPCTITYVVPITKITKRK